GEIASVESRRDDPFPVRVLARACAGGDRAGDGAARLEDALRRRGRPGLSRGRQSVLQSARPASGRLTGGARPNPPSPALRGNSRARGLGAAAGCGRTTCKTLSRGEDRRRTWMRIRFTPLLLAAAAGASFASSCTSSGTPGPPPGPKTSAGAPANPNPAPAT